MSEVITITVDHVAQALNRLLTQYRGKANWAALVQAFADQWQDAEDATFAMIEARKIANAVGQQLDNIGTLVGQPRLGFDDDFYRILIYVRIGQNTSQGGANKIIDIFRLLTQAPSVHYLNLGGGSMQLNTGVDLDVALVDFIYATMENVVAGGVRVDHIACYDHDDSFAFAGVNTSVPGVGFGDDDDANVGGKLAKVHIYKVRFAFAGTNSSLQGLSTLYDPVAGGTLAGIGG